VRTTPHRHGRDGSCAPGLCRVGVLVR
jgi:hypothetical protein